MNLVKLRSSTGRSVSCLLSNLVETSARSTFSSGEPPVTITSSDTAPIASVNVTGVCASTPTVTAGTTAVLKPDSSAFTS